MPLAKPDAATVLALTGLDIPVPVVESVIDDAALMADNACMQGYPEERQRAIVKWLSAHLLTSTAGGGMLSSEKLGDAQDSYARATLSDGLKGTTYGQQALLLDPNGCLLKLGKSRASIEVV